MRSRPVFFSPEWVFLALGLLAGALMCVFIPYGAGFDEETHLARIYDLAQFHPMPNSSTPRGAWAFKEFFELSYQRRYHQTPAWDLLRQPLAGKTGDQVNLLEVQTRSIYNPLMFVPQALVVGVGWRIFTLPIIPVVIAARLAGLLVYLAICFLAVRAAPLGKWILVVLGLGPMALFQAATLNADGFTIAASFLFIALGMRLAACAPSAVPGWLVWATGGSMLLLGAAKPGAILIFPLLLFLPLRGQRLGKNALVLWAAGALALLLTVWWSSAAVANSHFSAGGDQSVSRQLDLVLANPADFVFTFLRGFFTALPAYLRDWVGVYGYWIGRVPGAVVPLYLLALALAAAAEPRAAWFTPRLRAVSAVSFALSAGVIILMYFYANYAPGDASSLGKQGRYFLPMAPLLIIALAGPLDLNARRSSAGFACAVAALVVALGWYGVGLYATYYTFCGDLLYSAQDCAQPVYKNLDKAGAPEILLKGQNVLRQEFTNTCAHLTGVNALVKSLPASPEGSLTLTLLDPRGAQAAAATYPLADLAAGSYVYLPAEIGAEGQNGRFVLQLSADTPAGSTGPGAALTTDNYYAGGNLSAGGNEISADLIFHYFCARP